MNNVSLIGRLTADPTYSGIEDSSEIAKFSVAVDRALSAKKREEYKKNGKQTVDFPRIVTWGKLAKHCEKYLKKGMLVGISGKVRTYKFEKDDGSNLYGTEIFADSVKFLDKIDWKEDADLIWENTVIEE